MKNLDTRQKIQEQEYSLPYHYFTKPQSREGIFYYSYINPIVNHVNSLFGKKVLDAGCGDGLFISKLNTNNDVVGIDYSDKAINFARIINEQSKNKSFLVQDITKTEFDDDSFDVITNIAVFEHIPQEEHSKLFKEFKRILKQDGRLILAVPTHNLPQPKKHYHHFSLLEIGEIIKDNGFEIEKNIPVHSKIFNLVQKPINNRFWELSFLNNFMSIIFKKFFYFSKEKQAQMIVIFCRKLN